MKWQKSLSLICVLAITAALFAGCSSGKNTVKKNSFDKEAVSSVIDDKFIAENDNFKLEINDVSMGVTLTNKKTGEIYGTNPVNEGDTEFNEILGQFKPRHPQLESVLYIKYFDVKTNNSDVKMYSQTDVLEKGRVVFEKFENGIKFKYYFDDAEIMVPVTYTLRENGVAATVNTDEIQENDNMLLTVSLAPMFCSVKNKKDGYLFYPSGSGALVYAKEVSAAAIEYSAEVYGTDASKEVWDQFSTDRAIRLPVYGAKFNEQAVVGIIEQGSETASIDMKVGSTSIGYSGVYSTFQVRGYTDNKKELYNNRIYNNQVYSENLVSTPLTVCFYPLSGEKANYGGMAEVYRNYLNESQGETKNDKISTLDITMVGGTMIQKSFLGIPYKNLYAATTLSDAQDIVKDLNENGIKVSNLNLSGFGQNGIDSNKLGGGFAIDSHLGNVKQLTALNDNCSKLGTNLYFDFDIVGFNKSANGYDTYFDAAVRANKKVAKLYNFDIAVWGRNSSNSYSLLARDRLSDAADDVYSAISKWKIDGVAFSTLSSMAYADYSNKESSEYYAKAGMGKQVSEIYSLSKKNKVNVLSNDANAYAAAASNVVLSIPTSSTRADVFDVDVPFYAMAFRGRTAISGDSLNLAVDSNMQLLRSVESGAGIAYTLTNNYSTQLLDSASTLFYNSLYGDLKEQIAANYKKVSAFYEKIGNSEIASHNILENGLRETVFTNGVKVYVNYTDSNLESAAGTVEAKGFLVEEATS